MYWLILYGPDGQRARFAKYPSVALAMSDGDRLVASGFAVSYKVRKSRSPLFSPRTDYSQSEFVFNYGHGCAPDAF